MGTWDLSTDKMAYVAGSLARLSVRSWRQGVSVRLLSASGEGKEGIVKKAEEVSRDVEEVKPEDLVPVSVLSGVPQEQQQQRVARIFMPARNLMQSGSDNTHQWKLEFENQERWENPLMGWASSADPLSNLSLVFDSKEEAVAYAARNGWGYEIDEPKKPKMRSKTYAENFSWSKKTRVVSK